MAAIISKQLIHGREFQWIGKNGQVYGKGVVYDFDTRFDALRAEGLINDVLQSFDGKLTVVAQYPREATIIPPPAVLKK